jgi:hypothetical protein
MINIKYYNFIKNILDIIFKNKKYNIDINIQENDNFTEELTNILYPNKSKRNKITEHIINKIKFHFYNKKIYINTQESGSCAWFSLYWSILYYFIINMNDNNYYKFIKKILNKCTEIINDNYNNNDNYIKIFEDNLEKYFKFSDLCYKFININLLNNNIIEDNNYYNLLFKSQNLKWIISYDNQILSIENNVSSDNELDYLEYIGLIFKELKIENKKDNYSDIIFPKLFNLYIKFKNISIFKQNSNIVINSYEDFLNINNESLNWRKTRNLTYNYTYDYNYVYDRDLYIQLINLIFLYNNKKFLLPKSIINFYYISKILFDINNYTYDIREQIDFTYFLAINIIIITLMLSIIIIQQKSTYNELYKSIFNNFINSIFLDTITSNKFIKIDYKSIRLPYQQTMDVLNIPILSKYYYEYIINKNNNNQYLNIDLLDIEKITDFDQYLLENINIIYYDNKFIDNNIYLFIKSYIKYINQNENIKINLLKFYINRIFTYIKCDKNNYTFDYITENYLSINIYDYIILSILLNLNLINNISNIKVHFDIFKNNTDNTLINFIIIIYQIYKLSSIFDEFYEKLLNYNFNFTNMLTYVSHKCKIVLTAADLFYYAEQNFNIAFNLDYTIFKFIKKLNDIELIIIIIYYDNSIIEIKFNYTENSKKIILSKILDIKYENNKIIKYDEIFLPFKYVLPKNCPFIIYKNNSIYNILYLINTKHYLSSDYKEDMLGNLTISNNKIILEINKNNNLFITKNLDIFIELCLNFGINNFNKIFINKDKLKKKNKLYYNENDYYFDKNQFLLIEVDELKYYESKNKIENIIKGTEEEYSFE